MTSPDPVAQAAAYQASLLAELGDDDPAEVQAATPAAMRSLLAEAGPDVRTRPEPGEWSVLECLGHLTDGELVVSGRYRWIIAEETPRIVGYDQALWVDHLRHRDDDPDGLIAAVRGAPTGQPRALGALRRDPRRPDRDARRTRPGELRPDVPPRRRPRPAPPRPGTAGARSRQERAAGVRLAQVRRPRA